MSTQNLLMDAAPSGNVPTEASIEMQAMDKITNKRVILQEHGRLRQKFRFSSAAIKEPGQPYLEAQKEYPFIDPIGRSGMIPVKDYYLSPTHGKLRELVVQSSIETFGGANNSTWARRASRNISSKTVQLVADLYHEQDIGKFVVRWLTTCLLLPFTLLAFWHKEGIRWNGNYAPFPYIYHGYPKAARNSLEEQPKDSRTRTIIEASDTQELAQRQRESLPTGPTRSSPNAGLSLHSQLRRRLRPSRLNILTTFQDENGVGRRGFLSTDTSEHRNLRDTDIDPEYVFICYTRDQFAETDVQQLHQLASRAAMDAGVEAYWLDNCIPEGAEHEQEIYRIPDYVRQSKRVAIIRGSLRSDQPTSSDLVVGNDDREFTKDGLKHMLEVLGQRVWTFPEVLLAPGESIWVYTKGMEQAEPDSIPKMQVADIAFRDAPLSGDLINHFQGSLILSRLELITIALKCFHSRKLQRSTKECNPESDQENHWTEDRRKGDKAYALAGLLRVRPSADITDSEFQAFARLSLTNDSDQILERFICMQPKSSRQSWQTLQDAWNISLSDILPTCQISAIGRDDTVIIDGARGASVRWKSLAPVAKFVGFSWKRLFVSILIRLTPLVFWFSIPLIAFGTAYSEVGGVLSAIGGTGLALGVVLLFSLPKFIQKRLSGKAYGYQAWLFGIEGYMPIEEIERRIWHNNSNRLKWSPYGSPLSAHRAVKIVGEHGSQATIHVEGADPTKDATVQKHIDGAKAKGLKLFTLIDTVTMTVFLFLAQRPPVAFLICGQEGGMQRAVGVSYDHVTETVHREVVLRMETPILNRMGRVPRCRIGLGTDKDNLRRVTGMKHDTLHGRTASGFA